MKKLFISMISIIVLLSLSGCGKTYLESGNLKNDSSVLSIGVFTQKIVDLNLPSNDFSCCAAFSDINGFTYIISRNDAVTLSTDYYFISFDQKGNIKNYELLDLPIKKSGNSIELSDKLLSSFEELKNSYYDYGYGSYKNFNFDENGNFSATCEATIAIGVDDYGNNKYFFRTIQVDWDSNGKCISISELAYDENDYIQNIKENTVIGSDGNKYQICDSGIALLDDNGNYYSSYFDFINSNIISSGFSDVSIYDNDHFSGIYTDSYGDLHLASFTRNNSPSNKNALVLACTGLDNEIRSRIVAYNNLNSSYRIAVVDYLDRASSETSEEAWSMLREDLINGYNPDMVLNTSGYDDFVISLLSSDSRLCDLNNAILKDSDLKTVEFTATAKRMFYNNEHIYSIVPSFSYRTIVGNEQLFSEYSGWGTGSYLDFVEPISDKKVIFDMDIRTSYLDRLIEYNGNWYVNYDSCEASFNSEEFVDLLKYIITLPENYNDASRLMNLETNNGAFLLSDISCYNLGDMNLDSTILSKGNYTFVGYPCGPNDGSGVISVDKSFMIFSSSAGANECWDFIKYFITDNYQTNLKDGIPVTAAGFDIWHNNRQATPVYADQYKYYIDGEEHIVYSPTDEEVAYIEDSIDQCKRFEFSDYRIRQIVIDYVDQYFNGRISAEEAAQSIDKDVETYLSTL
jgi:hypothetical protein